MTCTQYLLRSLLIIGAAALPQLYAQEGGQLADGHQVATAFDFTKINSAITNAVNEYVASGTSPFTSLSVAFDGEKTSVDNDSYSLKLAMALPKTSYSEQGLQAEASISMQTKLQDTSNQDIDFGINATLKTDALAMLKSIVPALSMCDLATKSEGVDGILWQRHCQLLTELPKVDSVTELHKFLRNKLATHKADVKAYLLGLKVSLLHLRQRNNPVSMRAQRVLKIQSSKAHGVLAFFNKVTITKTTDGFAIVAPAYEAMPFFSLMSKKLEVSAGQVVINDQFTVKVGKFLYAATKPLIIELLQGLEQGNSCAATLIRAQAQIFGNLFKLAQAEQKSLKEE